MVMRALPLLALIAVAAGCGNTSGRYGPPPTSAESAFIRSCGSCHTLAAADTHGTVAKNLDELAPTTKQVVRAIETGPGTMPAGLLLGDEALLVAGYVDRNTG
jgi:mono/diheme cytochrome c family protein